MERSKKDDDEGGDEEDDVEKAHINLQTNAPMIRNRIQNTMTCRARHAIELARDNLFSLL